MEGAKKGIAGNVSRTYRFARGVCYRSIFDKVVGVSNDAAVAGVITTTITISNDGVGNIEGTAWAKATAGVVDAAASGCSIAREG